MRKGAQASLVVIISHEKRICFLFLSVMFNSCICVLCNNNDSQLSFILQEYFQPAKMEI